VIASAFPDQRIRGLLNYYGTHTGRWTSAGFNAHNLPREDSADALAAIAAIRSGDLEQVRAFGPPLDVIAGVARGLVIAPPDKLLLAGDFTTIEPRGASWFADEKWKLDSFLAFDETGDPLLDPYRILGARMRGVEVDPNDAKARQHGKTVTMAFNYGASVRVWRAFVPDDPRSDEEIKAQEVDKFRQLHPAQTQFMYNLDRQALRCVQYRQPVQSKRHGFEMDGDTLILRLPSGRPLFYPRANIRPGKFGRDVVAYHNPAKNREDEMWYGAWLAHLVSSTSRDLLVNALFNLDAAGFEIVLHVHDEIVAEIGTADVERDSERFKVCMLQAPEWAAGLPLAAKVRVGERYLKADDPAPIEPAIEPIVPKYVEVPATQIAAAQPQVCFSGVAEIPDGADKRTGELPNGPESERNPVPAQNEDGHVCAHCRRNPPDGDEHASAHGGLWLHASCEEAFIHARMAEEGIPWEAPGLAAGTETSVASLPPPPLNAPAGGANGSGNGANGHGAWTDEISLKDIVDEPLVGGKVHCPFHADTRPSCHIYDDHYHCFACGAHGDAINWLMEVEGLNFRAAQDALAFWEPRERPATELDESDRKTLALAQALWDEAEPIAGTRAIDYLAFRNIDVDQLTGGPETVLRFHPECPFEGAARVPCLLALFQDIDTDAFAGVHRIALTPSAFTHVPGSVKRRTLGRWAPRRRAVKLWPAKRQLVLGEGLETTLAPATRITHLGHPLRPAWAMLSAGAIEKCGPIPGVECVILLADNEPVGIQAVETAAQQLSASDCKAVILTPQSVKDFNDLVRVRATT
jgi:hypothetical protein